MFAAMSLATARKALNLTQTQLVALLTEAGYPASQALVSQWETGGVAISAERACQIEQVTGGRIRRDQLRPDLFGPLPTTSAANAPAHGEDSHAA